MGWWKLTTTCELTEVDIEHIAHMIREGYTEGEVVEDDEDEVGGR